MTDSTWFAFCDETVQSRDQVTCLEYLESLNAVLAVTEKNDLRVVDANSGETLQDCDGTETANQKLHCSYHKSTGNVVITNGSSVGYRSHNNGIFLLNTALQTPINSPLSIVTLELPISEARLMTNFIQDQDLTLVTQNDGNDLKGKEDSDNIDCVEELLSNLVKEISSTDETEKITPSGKWTIVKISLPYSTLKFACQTLLLCHQKYVQTLEKTSLIPGYHQPRHSAYGLPIVASMLHQLVLLYPADNPGCHGPAIHTPTRELMYAEVTRRATFTKWPHADYKYALPHAMAEAGFYHQPASAGDDRAMCFACSVCLVCWEPSDEPWSEHERHSPMCPFVCCEPTINVPLSLTHATQPASSNPFPTLEGSNVKPSIDFLCIGENSNLVAVASKCGMLATWDVSDVIPKLQNVCNISKSNVLYLLRQRLKQEGSQYADQFSSANFVVKDLEVTSLHVLDKLSPESELMSCDPEEFLTTIDGPGKASEQQKASSGEGSSQPSAFSLAKIPSVVVGVSVNVDPRPFKRNTTGAQAKPSGENPPQDIQESASGSSAPTSQPHQLKDVQKKDMEHMKRHEFSLLLFLKVDSSRSRNNQAAKQNLTMSKTTLFEPQSAPGMYHTLPLNNVAMMSASKGAKPFLDDDQMMPDLMDFGNMSPDPYNIDDINAADAPAGYDDIADIFPNPSQIFGNIGSDMALVKNAVDLTADVLDSYVESTVDENANVQVPDSEKAKPEEKGKLTSATILQLVVIDRYESNTLVTHPVKKRQIVTNILSTEDGRKLLLTTRPQLDDAKHTPVKDSAVTMSGEPTDMQIEEDVMTTGSGGDVAKGQSLVEELIKPKKRSELDPNTNEGESARSEVNSGMQGNSQNTPLIAKPSVLAKEKDQTSGPDSQEKKELSTSTTAATPTSGPPIIFHEDNMETTDATVGELASDENPPNDLGKIIVFNIERSHSVLCVSPKGLSQSDEGTRWMETSPIQQISNLTLDFSRASFEDDDDGDSMDGDEDEQIMKENDEDEGVGKGDNDNSSEGPFVLTLTEGDIAVFDIGKMEFVYRMKPYQAFSGGHVDGVEDATEQNANQSLVKSGETQLPKVDNDEKFTAFAYCSGTERLCASTNAGKLMFLKIGKHSAVNKDPSKSVSNTMPSTSTSATSTEQDQVDGPKRASSKLKPTSDQLLVNQPLTTENLKKLAGLIKSEPLRTRFTAAAPVCWREVPLDQAPAGLHAPQSIPHQEKAPMHKKKGGSQPAAAVTIQQQLQGRRHLRHPNEHFPEHASSYTRAWRLQPDCLSWREHVFELMLPRTTSLSHIELKFVLTRKLRPGSDIQVTLLKHTGLPSSKRDSHTSAGKKWRHHLKPTTSTPSNVTSTTTTTVEAAFPRVTHLLTEGFVESLMDVDIDNPVLLVVEEKEAEENVKKYVLMDGSKKMIVAICKRAPAELTVGHLVVLKGYMRVKVGASNVRIIVSALKYFTEDEITSMDVDEIRSMEEDWSSFESSYSTAKKEKSYDEVPEKQPDSEEAIREQTDLNTASEPASVIEAIPEELPHESPPVHADTTEELEEVDHLDKNRSSVLFGPVNLSDHVDASGIGGTVTIASRWLVKDSRHRTVFLRLEDSNAACHGGKKFLGMQSDEWRMKGCNHLQEISVVINKVQRVNIPHERVQRFSVMCSRSLHTKLLSSICDQGSTASPGEEKFTAGSLPEKVAALDILNWVAALEVADPQERSLIEEGHEKKNSNTVAVTRALSQLQTLAWLVCFSDGKLKKSSKSDKKSTKTDSTKLSETEAAVLKEVATKVKRDEKVQKVVSQSGAKYSLKRFLESCFLYGGREVSVRALRLIFNTLLSIEVQDNAKKMTGMHALCDAVVECLQKALEMKVESAYSMYCLYQILGVIMASKVQTGKNQSAEFLTLVKKCVSALSKASTIMKESIHPLHSFLRAQHGLYGTPFDPDRFTIEFVVTGNKNLSSLGGASPPNTAEKQQEWENYFSNEELNIHDLVTPKVLNIRRGLAVGDFVDGLSVSRFGLIECQPLHFTCVDTSEGCTVGVDSEIDSEGIIANASSPEISMFQTSKAAKKASFDDKIIKGLKTYKWSTDQFKELIELSDKYGLEDVNKILESYNYVKVDIGEGTSQQPQSYIQKMQQETAPKRSLPTFMDTSDCMMPEVDDSSKDATENKVPLNITVPNLSFALPPSTILTVSRMHSGARRRVVLDFGHIVEITDINIPSCPDLSSLFINAWSEGPKDIRSGAKVGKHSVTQVGVALDICDHDFVLCNLSPPVICRYLVITAIGRYGTTNIQTAVNLGRFYGRPAFVGQRRITPPQDSQSSVPSPPKKSMKNHEEENKGCLDEHPILIDALDVYSSASGRTAVQRSLAYLRSYLDDTDCRYSLACNELRSVLATNHAQESKRLWITGEFSLEHEGLHATRKKASLERLLEAYKKCSRLQVQKKRVSHSIRYMESMLGNSHTTPLFEGLTAVGPQSQLPPSYTQLQTYCELMLNTMLSLPHGIYFAPQEDPGRFDSAVSKEALIDTELCKEFFTNLVCNGNPRLRIQTVCLLLSYSSPFPWWGDFLCQTLETVFSGVDQSVPCLPLEHLFAKLLALGQRCLAVPQKAENVIGSLLNLLRRLLGPLHNSGMAGTSAMASGNASASIDLNLLTWTLLYMSHLTETVMAQNECFKSDGVPQDPSTEDPATSSKKRAATMPGATTTGTAPPSGSFPTLPKPLTHQIPLPPGVGEAGIMIAHPWKTGLFHGPPGSGVVTGVPGTSSPKTVRPPSSKPFSNTRETRSRNRWNFVSVSGDQANKFAPEYSGYMKILNWMQAINSKLKYHKSELRSLMKKGQDLEKRKGEMEPHVFQAKMNDIVTKASDQHRSVISYRRSLDEKNVYSQLQRAKPQDGARRASEAPSFPTAFVNISVQMCRTVLRRIIKLLLQLDFTVPSDFVVLACKVSSQLSRWCNTQCEYSRSHKSPSEGTKGIKPPLLLSELLNHEELKQFIILAVGGTQESKEGRKNFPEPIVGHPAGPWVNHALVSFLQDVIESENTALSSCEKELHSSPYSAAENAGLVNVASEIPSTSKIESKEPSEEVKKNSESKEESGVSDAEMEENMKNTEYSQRIHLVDNFIKLSENFLVDIKSFMKDRGEDPDNLTAWKSLNDVTPADTPEESEASTITMKQIRSYMRMQKLLAEGITEFPDSDPDDSDDQTSTRPVAAFLQNIRLTENGGQKSASSAANRQFLCSHIYDTRNVNGVTQHVELMMKLCTMEHLKLLSKSITHPPTAIVQEGVKNEDKMGADSVSLSAPLSTFFMLRKCIQEILKQAATTVIPMTTLCELILLLQETYRETLDWSQDFVDGESLSLIRAGGVKDLLDAVEAARGVHDNTLIWCLTLDLLGTVLDGSDHKVDSVKDLKLLLQPDSGLRNFLVQMLSRKMASTNVGNGHFNPTVSLLGPPMCAQLEKFLSRFEKFGSESLAKDPLGKMHVDLSVDLRNFLISVISMLCSREAFAHTSTTPTDGIIVVVKALLRLQNSNKDQVDLWLWTKNETLWILDIFQIVSIDVFNYLNWSKNAAKANSNRGFDPCSCMGGFFSAAMLPLGPSSNSTTKMDSPRDTLMLKTLQLCSELIWMFYPEKSSSLSSSPEKSQSSDKMDTNDECEPMDHDTETQEMEVDSSKAEDNAKPANIISLGDLLFENDTVIQNLMSSLALCTGSVMVSMLDPMCIRPALAVEKSATSTGDGVFLLLNGIFRCSRDKTLPVKAVLKYLAGAAFIEGRYLSQSALKTTSHLSQPLLWLILSVLKEPSVAKHFLSLGGDRLLIDSLVTSTRETINPSQGKTSKMLQYLTASSNRAAAFAPKPPVVLHNDGNFPVLGSGKPMHKVMTGPQGFNYPLPQGGVVAPGPMPSVKVLTQMWKENKDFDFAAVATIKCSDATAPLADSLLKPKAAVHRRSRTPLWSYHFPDDKHWVSLTLHFPMAFVLRKVKLQPMMVSLSTEPSMVLLEVNRTGSPNSSAYRPVSVPMVTSGMGDIVIDPPCEEIVTSLRIHMKRPLDSSSIGLTRIIVNGVSSFMSYDSTASTSSSRSILRPTETLNMIMAEQRKNGKSAVHWLRLLHHCLTVDDGKMAPMFRDVIIDAEGLIPTLCALLENMEQNIYLSAIEEVLLATAIPEKVPELVGCVLKGSTASCSSHFLGGFNHMSSESTVNVIYSLFEAENDQHLELRLKEVLKWATRLASGGPLGFRNASADPSHIHAIACGLWKCADRIAAKNCINLEMTKIIFNWGQSLTRLKESSEQYTGFSNPLKKSLDWMLCAFCAVNVDNYNFILECMGLTNTQASTIGMSNSEIETLAAVSQTKECIKILGTQGIVQLFSNGLQRFCYNVFEMYQLPLEGNENNLEAALEVTPDNAIAVVEFFSGLCDISLVQDWLGTEEGAKTWQILLKTLYHITLASNRRPMTGFPRTLLRNHFLLNLQESTTNLLKQVTKCNEHNQQLFTRAMCDIVSSQLDKSLRVTQLTGFIRSLLLRIVLEDELFTISMVTASGQKLQKRKSNSSLSGGPSLRHPAFGTGHLVRTFEVGVSSTLKQVWNVVSDVGQSLDQTQGSKSQATQKKLIGPELDPKKLTGTHFPYTSTTLPTSYASVAKPAKSGAPSASTAALAYEELLDVIATGKNAQLKRKSNLLNPSDVDSGSKLPSGISSLITLKCPELEEKNLQKHVTLLQLLAKRQKINVQSFWKSLTLEFYTKGKWQLVRENNLHTSVGTQTNQADVAMETNDEETAPNKSAGGIETEVKDKPLTETDKSIEKMKPLKTMLEVFASLGGLALVAERLPTVTLDIGHTPTSSIDQTKPVEPPHFSQQPDPYTIWGAQVPGWVDDDDWFGFEEEEYYVSPYGTSSAKIEQKSQMKMPPAPSVIGSSAANPCVPAHTMSALCLFLRVPHFAEEFLSEQKPARCLLRLMLGVQDDGQGEQILKLGLAQSLPMLPFTAIRSLLSHYGPTTDSGLAIREAMTFDTTSIHLVLACLSSFTHNEPSEDTAAGRLLASLLPDQESVPISVAPPSYKKAKQPLSAGAKRVNFANKQAEKNYWAKGTGFGTGSTTSDWDVGNAVKKQKKDEGYITVLLEVLANFVCPEGESDGDAAKFGNQDKKNSLRLEGKFAAAIPELLTASGLIPAIASYLRNDSVLDMAHHVPLYCSLLSVIRSFAVCPVLCRLLMDSNATTKRSTDDSSDASSTDSILTLLTKMRKCIDTYASRLKAINTSLESQGEEGLTTFVHNVQKTESMLSKIAQEMKSKESKGANSDSAIQSLDSVSPLSQLSLSADSLEKRYVEEMKNLQFDTAVLVAEDDEGVVKFPSGHHYATHIKEASNVTDAARARRLAQETVTLSNSLPLSHSSTVFVRCDEERLDVMKVLITGPSETPYANGCFEFDIFFPAEYNHSPPLVNLQTTGNHSVRFNPNLYNDGKVCLSILNTWHGRPEEKWDPQTSSFLQILVSIQSLILVAEPYFNEPGYERSRGTPAGEQNSREYDANIQQATVRWAMLEQLRNPSECFKDVIQYHFWLKRDEILAQCDKWTEDMKKRANDRHGRRTIAHNYTALQRHVAQLKQEMVKLKCPEGLEDTKVNNEN